MGTFLGIILFIITIVVGIVIVLVGRNKNKFIYSIFISIIMNLSNVISLFNGELYFLGLFVLLITSYVCSLLAYKIVNRIEPDSSILYVIMWEVIYNVIFYLIAIILGTL